MRNFRSMLLASSMMLMPISVYADSLIEFGNPESQAILLNATTRPEMWHAFSDVFRSYIPQSSQAYCGPTSLTIVLNSLGIPGNTAVDDWFPYLDMNTRTVFTMEAFSIKGKNKINAEGMTLDELGEAASTNKYIRVVTYHATPELGFEAFKKTLTVALTDPNSRVILNYHRSGLSQIGAGHFSPIAIMDTKTGRVLIMDTARYKAGPIYDKITKKPKVDNIGNLIEGVGDGSGNPVWATIEDVWNAANTIDDDAKAYRGIIVISKKSLFELKADEIKSAQEIIRKDQSPWTAIWSLLTSYVGM